MAVAIKADYTYKNPVGITNIGDPFVLQKNGMYFMYATSFIKGFYVWTSKDLKKWNEKKICYEADDNSFGYMDFWAPEVIFYKGKYIMHYTARWKKNDSLRIGVAVSDNPEGPFKDISDKPMFDYGYAAIDGTVLIDSNGHKYFYFSKDCSENIINGIHESHIYVSRLSDDLLSLEGEPVLLLKPDKEWEMKSGDNFRWNEAPCVLEKNGSYYLMYSANLFCSKYYSIGCAVSKSPLGPFIKYDNPVLTYIEGSISGPGHNSVFYTHDTNKLLSAYHVHTDYNKPSENRQMFIDRIIFKDNKLFIDGPTTEPIVIE